MNTASPMATETSAMHALDPAQREQALSRIDELSMRAGRTERANRPTMLLLLAGVGLAGGFIFLLSAISGLSDARAALASRRENAEQMVLLAAQLKQMREFSGESATLVQEPDPQMLSRIAQIASSAGLSKALPIPTRPAPVKSRDGSVQRVKLLYRITDPSLSAVLGFVSQAERDVPGIKVHSIKITPNAEQWSVEVTLSRVERVE